jgi:hypothetical protein
METILANASGKVRRLVRNGRKVMVARAVLIVPGVLEGSQGRLLYTPEECAKKPRTWDGMPLVIRHPVVNGKPSTARRPEVLDATGVGFGYSTRFDGTLNNECHFDEEDLKRVCPDTYAKVDRGDKIELSTGLFTENVMTPGDWHGVPYDGIAVNHEPDHIAILPDQKGACCIDDGCGVNANSSHDSYLMRAARAFASAFSLTGNAAMSHDELRMKLSELIHHKYGKPMSMPMNGGMRMDADMPYVIDVFDRNLVFYAKGRKWRVGYRTDLRTSSVSLDGDPVEVRKVSTYRPVTNAAEADTIWTPTENKDSLEETSDGVPSLTPTEPTEPNPTANTEGDMATRKENIDYLVANCECWKTEEGKKDLEKLGDKAVEALVTHDKKVKTLEATHNAAVKGFSDANGTEHRYDPQTGAFVSKPKEPVGNAKKDETPTAQPVTTEQYLSSAPPEIRELLNNARETERNEKALLCNRLTEHIADQPTRTQEATWLMNKPLSELRRLSAIAPPKPAQQQAHNADDDVPGLDYLGASVPNTNQAETHDEDVLEPVANMNWSGKGEEE